ADEFAIGARNELRSNVVKMLADVVSLDVAIFADAVAHYRLDHDPVAWLEIDDALADLDDLAGEFMTDDVTLELGFGLVPMPQVSAAYARHTNARENKVARRDNRPVDFRNFKTSLSSLKRSFHQ